MSMHDACLRLAPAALALALAACASAPPPQASPPPTGAVGMRSIDKQWAGAQRMELAANETFQMPLAEAGNAAPHYPQELLAQRLPPQTVCLSVGIGAQGRVIGSRALAAGEGCPTTPTPQDPRFVEAARAAVAAWRFDPAFRCVYPGTKPVDEQGCVSGREEAVPVSLAYSFVFEQKDGRGTVRMGE
ncbi:hypothetical protein D9T17_20060 [Lysobacter enzymogenes]|uniref:Lipoprotein n=2 Tax=Lysobacter enzymogenes TaxID=69 RepID=A0A3N2RCC7_LYSEN|nr:hypothetical protein D9T17_20060 [Lysobacter enzymogenes]